MVGHWWRKRGPGSMRNMLVNGLGALATGVTLLVVLVAKFTSGAWVSALLIVAMVTVDALGAAPLPARGDRDVLHVGAGRRLPRIADRRGSDAGLEQSGPARAGIRPDALDRHPRRSTWRPKTRRTPCGRNGPKWSASRSRRPGGRRRSSSRCRRPTGWSCARSSTTFCRSKRNNPGRQIAVIVPELVEKHWYHYPLHNQRAELLKALILLHGSQRIVLINVPWYLKA